MTVLEPARRKRLNAIVEQLKPEGWSVSMHEGQWRSVLLVRTLQPSHELTLYLDIQAKDNADGTLRITGQYKHVPRCRMVAIQSEVFSYPHPQRIELFEEPVIDLAVASRQLGMHEPRGM